ncbi:oxidoreductase [Gluconacetobacter tumulisoli]|uniref:FAD-dependent oxidoreductase n=1 Tax=Gluconacetobacter tumulisoli TaxID=1286189 RepID=A0A7W4PKY0_9PROT|nr:FAD-dependent oxidoreductase [Gluconacetobacter tumulisoli]MBB2200079.1 FAD-dependent oxidoreductase [Gluconacetobacter tumulisoli]
MTQAFSHLFAPLRIRDVVLKNRIMSTGHDTTMPTDGRVNDTLVAYHEARARGGVGLIVVQVAGVHETARYTSHMLMATDDGCIDGYRRLAETCHAHGCAVFGQLFHPGREIMESADGLLAVAYAPSVVPSDRFRVMPRALDPELIAEIVAGYGAAAERLCRAGLDGVEFVASHGYLPAQFLNPRVNLRDDAYGGTPDNRLRFAREALAEMRRRTHDGFVIGMRISGSERDEDGLTGDEVLAACRDLEPLLDYVNVTAGTSASYGGAVHIVPPMSYRPGYVAPDAVPIRAALDIPVFVNGRVNQPQEAEKILESGAADMCGMTRAMICDPEMPAKTALGRLDDIRACIGCNQACIGHFHRGLPISCIQHPETGRERQYGRVAPADAPRRVMVVGGGPAGMKAAITAARRGHDVTLYEAGPRLGGQALLAQLLPRRAEFGGLVTNLAHELSRSGARVVTGVRVDADLIRQERPDSLILASGARPYVPPGAEGADMQVVDAWQVLRNAVPVGARVLVVDWRGDWIAPGVAESLALAGRQVRLATSGHHPGEQLPFYVRDDTIGELYRLEIDITPMVRFYGCDGSTVFLQHAVTGAPVVVEGIDTLVLACGHVPETELERVARELVADVRMAGDCLAPRTAEEAVMDGLRAGWDI